MRPVKDGGPSPLLRALQGAAYTVIIMWGVRFASAVLGPLLLAFLLAHALLPFPKWLMQRFKLRKRTAIALTAVAAASAGLYVMFVLDLSAVRIEAKMPIYEQRLAGLYQQIEASLNADGVQAPDLSVKNALTPERLRAISRVVLPEAGMIISNGLLISLVGFLFLMEMADDIGVKRDPLRESLAYYGPTRAVTWPSRPKPLGSTL
jgi:predicted PurR-regulated permease PerM